MLLLNYIWSYKLNIIPYLCTSKFILSVRLSFSLRIFLTYSQYNISQKIHICPTDLWIVALQDGNSFCLMSLFNFTHTSSKFWFLQRDCSIVHLALQNACSFSLSKLFCSSWDKGWIFSLSLALGRETLQDLFNFCFPLGGGSPWQSKLIGLWTACAWIKVGPCFRLEWNSRRFFVQS